MSSDSVLPLCCLNDETKTPDSAGTFASCDPFDAKDPCLKDPCLKDPCLKDPCLPQPGKPFGPRDPPVGALQQVALQICARTLLNRRSTRGIAPARSKFEFAKSSNQIPRCSTRFGPVPVLCCYFFRQSFPHFLEIPHRVVEIARVALDRSDFLLRGWRRGRAHLRARVAPT